jgi:putative phage-type endonuclease
MAQLIVERLTGVPAESFMNDAMRWGIEKEPEAKLAYSFRTDNEVIDVGLVRHPVIEGTHASPDGLIGADGLIEAKCPQSATHLDYLLAGSVPQKYRFQCQWQMACTDRQWCDFISFDPRMPEHMRLFIVCIHRDDELIATLEAEVITFLGELDRKLDDLRRLYPLREAA